MKIFSEWLNESQSSIDFQTARYETIREATPAYIDKLEKTFTIASSAVKMKVVDFYPIENSSFIEDGKYHSSGYARCKPEEWKGLWSPSYSKFAIPVTVTSDDKTLDFQLVMESSTTGNSYSLKIYHGHDGIEKDDFHKSPDAKSTALVTISTNFKNFRTLLIAGEKACIALIEDRGLNLSKRLSIL